MRHILHIHNKSLPPAKNSGGSNRLIDWLAKEQFKLGHKVYVMSPIGHSTEYFTHIKVDFTSVTVEKLIALIPNAITDIEYHGGLEKGLISEVEKHTAKFLTVIHAGTLDSKNPVYVSSSHAKNFNQKNYIYNGVPEGEVSFSSEKKDYFLFLAKVKRSKKGVDTAIKLAKKSKEKLVVAGGWRLANPETWFSWHPLIQPVGFINGEVKKDILKYAKALLVPIKWEEPFGLTVVEAMLSGTPVIAFNRGAMPELIKHGVTGYLCDNDEEFLFYMNQVNNLCPDEIRKYAISRFSSDVMAKNHLEYLDLSERVTW